MKKYLILLAVLFLFGCNEDEKSLSERYPLVDENFKKDIQKVNIEKENQKVKYVRDKLPYWNRSWRIARHMVVLSEIRKCKKK